MLIHLYNGKNPQEFVKEYKIIIDNVSIIYIVHSTLKFE